MRPRHLLLALPFVAAGGAVALPACQTPTSIVVSLSTNLSCSGAQPAFMGGELSVLRDTTVIDGSDVVIAKDQCNAGAIGTMTVIPGPAGIDGTVRIAAAAWLGNVNGGTAVDARDCIGKPGSANCIVSTRSLRFFRHEALSIPIFLDSACAGKTCPTGQTCGAGGVCISEQIDEKDAAVESGVDASATPLLATRVWAGGNGACALLVDKTTVVCWGDSKQGQLGKTGILPPTKVALSGAPNVELALGGDHTCAWVPTAGAGQIQCFGANDQLQLGDPNATGGTSLLSSGINTWQPILAAGASHTCARVHPKQSISDVASCWGRAVDAQVDGTAGKAGLPPTLVGTGDSPLALAVGDAFSCALTPPLCGIITCDPVLCWGDNVNGQVGQSTKGGRYFSPIRVGSKDISNATALVAGARHALVISDGKVWGWGDGTDGQLGKGGDSPINPSPIEVAPLAESTAIAATSTSSCGVGKGGAVTCVGGLAGIDLSAIVADGGATAIVGGTKHVCVLTKGSHVMCFGSSDAGQLGGAAGPAPALIGAP